jgi:biopolymer transport protein ExbD
MKRLIKKFYFVVYFTIYLTSCKSQETHLKTAQKVDTLQLFNPKGINDGIEKIVKEKNCILLQPQFYQIYFNEREHKIFKKHKLDKFLRDSCKIIRQKKFFIIIDSSRKFEEIIDLVSSIKKAGIEDYQVFNIQKQITLSSPEPLVIEGPTSVSKKVDSNDPTYLKISLINETFKISFHNDSLNTNDILRIDKFISENKLEINPNKILLITDKNFKMDKFKELKEVLKKHEYFRFSIVTKSGH